MLKKEIKKFNALDWRAQKNYLNELFSQGKFENIVHLIPPNFRKLKVAELPNEALEVYLIFARALGLSGSGKLCIFITRLIREEVESRTFESLTSQYACRLAICRILDELSLFIESAKYSGSIIAELEKNPFDGYEIYLGKLKINHFRASHNGHVNITKGDVEEFDQLVDYIKKNTNSSNIYISYLELMQLELRYSAEVFDNAKLLENVESALAKGAENFYSPIYQMLKIKLLIRLGKKIKATELLLEIKKDLDLNYLQLNLEVFDHLNNLSPESLALEDHLLLRAYPYSFHVTYGIGNLFYKVDNSLQYDFYEHAKERQRIPKALEEHNLDSWLITKEDVSPIEYKTFKSENVLDLKVGIFKKSQSPLIVLSSLRAKCLMFIIGSSNAGISILQLSNILFGNEKLPFETIILRTQDLVTQLQKLNFPIKRNDWKVYFDIKQVSYPIILPRDFTLWDVAFYFSKNMTHVDSKTICNTLNVKKTHSWAYIKKWQESGYLKKDAAAKSYKFLI